MHEDVMNFKDANARFGVFVNNHEWVAKIL